MDGLPKFEPPPDSPISPPPNFDPPPPIPPPSVPLELRSSTDELKPFPDNPIPRHIPYDKNDNVAHSVSGFKYGERGSSSGISHQPANLLVPPTLRLSTDELTPFSDGLTDWGMEYDSSSPYSASMFKYGTISQRSKCRDRKSSVAHRNRRSSFDGLSSSRNRSNSRISRFTLRLRSTSPPQSREYAQSSTQPEKSRSKLPIPAPPEETRHMSLGARKSRQVNSIHGRKRGEPVLRKRGETFRRNRSKSKDNENHVYGRHESLLQQCLATTQKNNHRLVRAVQTCPVVDLCCDLSVLGCVIDMFKSDDPLEAYLLAKALVERFHHPDVAQAISFLNHTIKHPLFEDMQTSDDAEVFFKQISEQDLAKGMDIPVPSDMEIYHPFIQDQPKLVNVEVLLAFPSNAHPVLLQLGYERQTKKPTSTKGNKSKMMKLFGTQDLDADKCVLFNESPMKVILKAGDDLRQDVACLQGFRLMNTIWRQSKVRAHDMFIEAKVYQCISIAPNLGFMEFVPDCKSLNEIKFDQVTSEDDEVARTQRLHRLVTSAAGSYIACYVLGIRDRHSDNILVDKNGSLFHIDFGYILGKGVPFDTYLFAIPTQLKAAMGIKWELFVHLCVRAFKVLRENQILLMKSLEIILSQICPPEETRQFLNTSLLLDMSAQEAAVEIRRQLNVAPTSLRTKFKNKMHNIAMAGKS